MASKLYQPLSIKGWTVLVTGVPCKLSGGVFTAKVLDCSAAVHAYTNVWLHHTSPYAFCVAGASAGIGLAAARRFAEAGTKLVLVARRLERLEALKEELQTQYNVRSSGLSVPCQLLPQCWPSMSGARCSGSSE